eukprot:21406-Heterococcus_DN1.PRE.5
MQRSARCEPHVRWTSGRRVTYTCTTTIWVQLRQIITGQQQYAFVEVSDLIDDIIVCVGRYSVQCVSELLLTLRAAGSISTAATVQHNTRDSAVMLATRTPRVRAMLSAMQCSAQPTPHTYTQLPQHVE